MKLSHVVKSVAPLTMALGMAAGAALVPGTAMAATRHVAKVHTSVKAGVPCTKAELHKTDKVGKEVLVCEKAGAAYKWEAHKNVARKAEAKGKPAATKTGAKGKTGAKDKKK
jgi:hypothetical protein